MIRLGILLLLFDVYLTWARIEKQFNTSSSADQSSFSRIAQQPIVLQYMFFCEHFRVYAIQPVCPRR